MSKNMRNEKFPVNGEMLSKSKAADKYGLSRTMVSTRTTKLGMTLEDAINMGKRVHKKTLMKRERFGHLVVISDKIKNMEGEHSLYDCACDCGKTVRVLGLSLASGKKTTCNESGCNFSKRHHHGLSTSSEYGSWQGMKARCGNPNNPVYAYYGGRGIGFDPRWEVFSNFIEDMGFKASPDLSLDRIDSDKDYFKENCRWATKREQALNRRRVNDLTSRIAELEEENEQLKKELEKMRLERKRLIQEAREIK